MVFYRCSCGSKTMEEKLTQIYRILTTEFGQEGASLMIDDLRIGIEKNHRLQEWLNDFGIKAN